MSSDTLSNNGMRLPSFLRQVLEHKWWKCGPVVPVLRLSGVIGSVTPLRPGLTLASCAGAIERAFSVGNARAVVIQINSPGGSPVQSRLIYQRIRSLAKEKTLPVYVFAEDVAASGGYMLALAGDEIYVDSSTIVGSIGVISASFGFVDLIQRLGIERRVYTAGEKKMTLDSFQPENADDVAHLKGIQKSIHEDFIELVKERRGPKIEAAGDQLFTGEFWAGRQAVALGLVDGIIDARTKMRELYGDDVRLKLISMERGLFRRRLGVGGIAWGAGNLSWSGAAGEIISALEARAIWARFGF
jgi:signal peptide peptidase SppA